MKRVLLCALFYMAFLCAAMAQDASVATEKPVAICFIGTFEKYATRVAPLLKKEGFGATFYVDDPPGRETGPTIIDERRRMTWKQIAELSAAGFEIGNASEDYLYVVDYNSLEMRKSKLLAELDTIDRRCAEQSIPKPVTFCYKQGWAESWALQGLADRGCIFAVEYRSGLVFDPAQDHPLLLPALWFYGHQGEREKFYEVLQQAKPGEIPVFCFDGVDIPGSGTHWELFAEYMKFLAEQHYKVVSVRDLASYANPGGAMRAARVWRRTGNESPHERPVDRAATVAPTALEKQLAALMMPELNFKETKLGDVLDFLRQKAKAVSNGTIDPAFVTGANVDLSVPVTLRLPAAPFMEALRCTGDLARVRFAVEEHAISAKPMEESAPPVTPGLPPTAQQTRALESTVIASVDFEKAPLPEVLEVIASQAAAASRDVEKPCFVPYPGVNVLQTINLHAAGIPLTELLGYAGDLAGVDFVPGRYAMAVLPRVGGGGTLQPKTPPTPGQMNALHALMVPKLEFKDASLGTVLDFLRGAAVRAQMQVSFIIEPGVNLLTPVTIDLENVPFTEALRYTGEAAHVEIAVERYAIVVRSKRAAPGAEPAPTPFALVK